MSEPALERYILAVEDEPIATEQLEQILRDQGYMVLSVSSGEDAVAKIRDLEIDIGLILMDIRLNGVDGIEWARQIRKRDRGIPIILISAYAHLHQDRIEKYDLRIASQFEKPLNKKKLNKLLKVIKREFEKLKVRIQIQDEILAVVDSPTQMHERLRQLAKPHKKIDLLIEVLKDIAWIHKSKLDATDIGDSVAYLNYIAYQRREEKLRKEHAGEYVAFLHGEKVGHSKERGALIRDVYQQHGRMDVLIVEVDDQSMVKQRRPRHVHQ